MHSAISQPTQCGSAWIAVITEDTSALPRFNTEHNLQIWKDLRGHLLITHSQIPCGAEHTLFLACSSLSTHYLWYTEPFSRSLWLCLLHSLLLIGSLVVSLTNVFLSVLSGTSLDKEKKKRTLPKVGAWGSDQ